MFRKQLQVFHDCEVLKRVLPKFQGMLDEIMSGLSQDHNRKSLKLFADKVGLSPDLYYTCINTILDSHTHMYRTRIIQRY